MKRLWNWPQGELIKFNSPDEVKTFFSKMTLDPEESELFGIKIKTTPEVVNDPIMDDYEYNVEVGGVYKSPVFDLNDFMSIEQQYVSKPSYAVHVEPENIVLDETVYSSFPCVAYIFIVDTHDRLGDVKMRFYNVKPISELQTINDVQDFEDKYFDKWEDNYKKLLELEKKRDL